MARTLEDLQKQIAERKAKGSAPAAPAPAPAPTPAPEAKRPAATTTPVASTPVRPPAPKPPAPKPAPAPVQRMDPEAAYFKAKVAPNKDATARSLGYKDFATLEAVRRGDLGSAPQVRTKEDVVAATEGRRAIEQAQRETAGKNLEEQVSDVWGTAPYFERVVGRPLKEVGAKLLPAVADFAGKGMDDPATKDVDEGAKYREFWMQQFQDAEAQAAKRRELEERRKEAKFDVEFGQRPDMLVAKQIADKLRATETPKKPSTSGQLIKELTEYNMEKLLAERGGPDAVVSGPEHTALYRRAKDMAVAEAVDLSSTGAWHLDVSPKDVAIGDNVSADWRALLPRQKLSEDGTVVRSESLPGWFFNVPLSLLDASVLSLAQGLGGGDIKERDLSTRLWENIAGRQDVLSYRIEQDPELQADLSSGDMERVNRALATLAPMMAVTMVTPDPVSVATGGLAAVGDVGKLVRHAPTLTQDLKAATKAADKVKVLTSAVEKAREADKAAKEASKLQATAQRALSATEQVRAGTPFDEVVKEARTRDPAVAIRLQDDLAAVLRADPDVAAYLEHLGSQAGDVTKEYMPEVSFGPEDIQKRADIAEEMSRIRAEIRDIEKKYKANLEENDYGSLPMELREQTARQRDRLKRLAEDVKKIDLAQQAAKGRERLGEWYDRAVEFVVSDLEKQAKGEKVPTRPVSHYTGAEPGVRATPPGIDQDTWDILLGPDTTVAAAERLAAVQTPEELIKTLSRLPQSTRDRIALRLMFVDYDALKEGAKTTAESVETQRAALVQEVRDLRAKYREARDRHAELAATPEQAKAYAAAKKALTEAEKEAAAAEKELLAAGKVNITTQQKLAKAEAALAETRAKYAGAVSEAERKLGVAQAGAISEDEAEIADLQNWLQYIHNDLDPTQIKNVADQGGRATQAGEVFKRERELDEIATKLADARIDTPEGKALSAAEEALHAFDNPPVGAKPANKARAAAQRAKLVAAVEQAKAAYAEATKALRARQEELLKELGPTIDTLLAQGVVGNEKKTPKQKKLLGHYEKLLRVQVEARKRKLEVENKIAAIQARMKAQGPQPPNAKASANVAKAEATLAKARGDADVAVQVGEMEVRKLRDAVEKQRAEANAAFEAARERVRLAQEKHAAAQSAYQGTPSPTARVQKGVVGDERIAKAAEAVEQARTKLIERAQALLDVMNTPDVRAGIEVALGGLRDELSTVAAQARARETFFDQQARYAKLGLAPDPTVFEARDLQQLRGELVDILDRDLRRANTRGSVGAVARGVYDAFKQFWSHNADVQEASIRPALRHFTRRLQGEIEEVGEKLARAVTSIDDSDAVNTRALAAVDEEVAAFKEAVKTKQIASEYAAYVIGAYIQSDVPIAPERAKRLAQVLSDWAADDAAPLSDLRNKLLEATRAEMGPGATVAQLQKPQLGDVFLAYGVGSAGATHRAMRETGFLAMSPQDAASVNSVLTDLHRLGGNPTASAGRQRALEIMVDPDLYRPSIVNPARTGLRETTAEPMVPIYSRASLPKPQMKTADDVRRDLGGLMDELERAGRQDVYVPRAVRDAIGQQIEAVIATRRVPQNFDTQAMLQFWRQARIVGVGPSNPVQGFMDHIGDTLQIAAKYPLVAAKTTFRSTPSQALHVPVMAQVGMLIDYLRKAEPGTAAKMFDRVVGAASFTPDVQRVLDMSDELVGNTGMTGKQVWRALREAGLPETLLTGQITRSTVLHASKEAPRPLAVATGAVAGALAGAPLGGPAGVLLGGIAGAVFGNSKSGRKLAAANHAALVGLSNVAATRRRVALAVGLMEKGMSPAEAGQEAVRLVGAFSREIGPTERAYVTWWFPFFAYRKFNTRRTFQMLANPYWMKFLQEGSRSAEMAANAYLDDTDEYGFHTGPMDVEPDPSMYQDILNELFRTHQDWTEEARYQEADRLAADLPRAIERYKRVLPFLRGKPYQDARLYVLDSEEIVRDAKREHPNWTEDEVQRSVQQVVEDLDALRAYYWAPDPVKEAMPEWAKDRFTLYLGKARSQELVNLFRSGQGKMEKPSDEMRYVLPFTDPNVEGVGTMLALAAATSNLAGPSSGTAGKDLLGVVFRQSWVQTIMSLADIADPDGEQDTPISQQAGENLLAVGLGPYLEIRNPQEMPYDPANYDPTNPEEQKKIRELRYYIPAKSAAAMYLLPQVFGGTLAALRAMEAAETLTGGGRTTGAPDAVDQYGAYAFFATGTRVRQSNPSTQAFFERQEVEKKMQARLEDVKGVKPSNTTPLTDSMRLWTSLYAQPDFDAKVQAAVQDLQAGKGITSEDVERLRAALVARTGEAERVFRLTDKEVATEMATSP